jgi:hypothetical protein
LAVKPREPETSASDTRSRDGGVRAAGRDRRGLMVRIVLLLAFSGAGLFVLLLGGGSVKEQDPGGSAVRTVVAEPSPLPAGAAPVFDAEALREQLEEIAEGHEGVYGVAVLEPVSGTKISLRGDEEFMTASSGKLPVLATLYRAGAQGTLDLEEEVSILPGDIQNYGNGELLAFPVSHSLSLQESAYRLVNHSDNTAWAMLNRRLGEDKIRAEIEDMGIKNSRYSDRLSSYFMTPNDMLLLLEKISDPQFTSENLSVEMLDGMIETTRLESGVDDWPASQLGPVENSERDDQNVEPAKPPLDEKSLPALWQSPPEEKSLSESRRNVADPPFVFAPLDSPTIWEPVDSEEFVLIFPEETIDQEVEEEDEAAAEQ